MPPRRPWVAPREIRGFTHLLTSAYDGLPMIAGLAGGFVLERLKNPLWLGFERLRSLAVTGERESAVVRFRGFPAFPEGTLNRAGKE